MVQIFNSMLSLYGWIVAAILIVSLYLIGRFYEIQFGQKSHYQWFLLPAALFVAAAVWYVFFARDGTGAPLHDFVGAFWPDLLYLVGGLVLIGLCFFLHTAMMGDRR